MPNSEWGMMNVESSKVKGESIEAESKEAESSRLKGESKEAESKEAESSRLKGESKEAESSRLKGERIKDYGVRDWWGWLEKRSPSDLNHPNNRNDHNHRNRL